MNWREVINNLEENWNVVIIAITSDAGGEALKARKMEGFTLSHKFTYTVHTLELLYWDCRKTVERVHEESM